MAVELTGRSVFTVLPSIPQPYIEEPTVRDLMRVAFQMLPYVEHIYDVHWFELPMQVRREAIEKVIEQKGTYRTLLGETKWTHAKRIFSKGARYLILVWIAHRTCRVFDAIERNTQEEVRRAKAVSSFINASPNHKAQMERSREQIKRGEYVELTPALVQERIESC